MFSMNSAISPDDYWLAYFALGELTVTSVAVTAGANPEDNQGARIYIGNLLCGTLPASMTNSNTAYTTVCGSPITGGYVKLVSGTLSLSNVSVTTATKEVTNNYCRKPYGFESTTTIWCYTTATGTNFEECSPVAEEEIYLEEGTDASWTSQTYDQSGEFPNAFTPFATGTTLFAQSAETSKIQFVRAQIIPRD